MIYAYLVCLILLLYFLYRKSYTYWESRGVPYDKPFLFFGSFLNVARRKQHVLHVIRSIYNSHKTPYVGFYIFGQPNLMIRSPELLRKILVKDFDKFSNRKFAANESVDPLSFHNLFSAKDTTWKNLRSKISPVFTSGKMKLMLPLIKECARDLDAYLQKHDGSELEFRNVTQKFTVDVISSCAFGINANCLKNEDAVILKMAKQLIDPKSFKRNLSVFAFFFLPKLVDIFRLTFADRDAANFLINIFKEALRVREEKKIVRNDLIDLLNNLKKNETIGENYKFDDLKMAAQAIVFFGAGNNTTSATLTFALYELALNQDVQEKLRQELKEAYDKDGDFTYENLQEIKYLDMVLSGKTIFPFVSVVGTTNILAETLRKYPLVAFLNRVSTSSYTFEETGFTLEKDVSIMVPVPGLHFDPEYFPDPEKFDPERFRDKNKIKPYTYMPFGEGPRNCIGERFGLLVAKVGLAFVVKNYAFEVTLSTPVPMKLNPSSFFVESRDGVHLKIVKK